MSLSLVAISCPRWAPDKYVLLRADWRASGIAFVWCGRALGWLPSNTTTRMYHVLYGSMEEAQEAADEYIHWPLTLPDRVGMPG